MGIEWGDDTQKSILTALSDNVGGSSIIIIILRLFYVSEG